jgi:Ca-activated chloride channel family protein
MDEYFFRRLGGVAALAAMWGLSPLWAQEARPTFRSGVSRVTLNVVVRDRQGRAVAGLADRDFQIFDQGRAVDLSDFGAGEAAVSIALLIDTSGSMGVGPRLAAAKQAARMLLDQLRDGDEAALFTFDRTLHEIAPFSSDLAGVRRGFDRVNPFGSTSLHDAVAAASRASASRTAFRRAVIAVTDGFDNSSELSAAAASSVASSIDVPVYILAVANTSDPIAPADVAGQRPLLGSHDRGAIGQAAPLEPVEGTGLARLDDLTRWTGGASLAAETPAQASLSVREIVTDLRAGYVMAFAPQEGPGWHLLTVRVARKGATVRTRAGFWIEGPASTSR